MPFSSIKWTVLKCTDILIPVQPWDFLAFAKLWPYLVWANIQSILPSCLLFPNPPTSLPARYSWGSEHCSMVFALSGALWIECQYCQAACLSFCRWIPDSNSSLSCLLYFTLSCMWLPFLLCSQMNRCNSFNTKIHFYRLNHLYIYIYI